MTYQDQEYKDGNKEYFGNFQNSIWTIFLIITSTGFPTQILPSYSDSRDSIIFFIFTVSMGAFVFLNLILLVVNSEFETGKNKREAVESNYRSLNLQLAFEILDIENKGFLLYSDIDHLLEVLYTNFSDFRKRGVPSDKMRRILVACMDVNSNRKISTREFSMILDVTRISLKRNDRHNYMELCFPGIIKSVIFQKMRRIVLHRHFSLLIDTLILVCMCIEFASGKSVYSIVKRTSQISLGAMCIVMLIEMLLKLAVFGKRYFAHFDRKLEYFFSVSLVLILIFTFGINVVGLTEGTVTMRLIGLGRLCLALRNVDLYFPALGFKNLAKIFLRVGKNLGSLTISFLVTMISFCILGMYLFGGLINRDPNRDEYENILESRYGDSDYWPLNFNDIPSGLMTLVCVLHISDWDVITEGFTAAVGNKYPRIYFTSWYCIGVLLLLNIVKSFFMRGFFINREIFISTTRADVTQSSSLPDDDTVLISVDTETQRPRRETQAYIHGYNAEDVDPTEIKDNDLFSASIGALKFLPTEEKFFLMNRIDYVLKEGQKYREF